MRYLLCLLLPLLAAAQLTITRDSQPAATIQAPEALAESAETLNRYIEQITGTRLPTDGAGLPIIRLALGGAGSPLEGLPPGTYSLTTEGDTLTIRGNSPKAVHDGVHGLLYHLGVRWLQPGERWTVIPEHPTLTIPELQFTTTPAFAHRDIWYAYGTGLDPSRETLAADYQRWVEGNRLGGHAPFKSGHTYPSTVGNHAQAFQNNPDYFAMTEEGNRLSFNRFHSICYSNPEVAKLFIQDKLAELRADKARNPLAYSVSMDPNDGSSACYCPDCQALGNGSDQCLHLANQVARALRQEFPEAVVSFYVYASHRLPPEKVKAEPNVAVQVATAFNKTNLTLDELVARWRDTVSAVGIRDYLGVMAWDWGLPGRARGTSFPYIREAIPRFHAWGAIAYNAEMNINWGAHGPATTTAARLLWDTDADARDLYDDWFAHAYGPAAETMQELHARWEESTDLTRQNLHEWYRLLEQAFAHAANATPAIQSRLADMIVLLEYARLYRDYGAARAAKDREAAYEALLPMLTFTWRTRHRGIVHAYALQRRLVNSGDPILRPLENGYHFKDPDALYKHPQPLTDLELMAIFEAGLKATPPDDRHRRFAGPLVVVEAPGPELPPTAPTGYLRYASTWEVLVPEGAPLQVELPMEGVRFNYRLHVENPQGDPVWQTERTIQTEARYDRQAFTLPVQLPAPGHYRFRFTAGEDYRPDFPADWHAALRITESDHPMIRFYGPAAIYVPAGTTAIFAKTDGRLSLQAPGESNRRDYTAADEDPAHGCLVIPIQGETPQLWLLNPASSGRSYFYNVPKLLNRPGYPLLVPQEAAPDAR